MRSEHCALFRYCLFNLAKGLLSQIASTEKVKPDTANPTTKRPSCWRSIYYVFERAGFCFGRVLFWFAYSWFAAPPVDIHTFPYKFVINLVASRRRPPLRKIRWLNFATIHTFMYSEGKKYPRVKLKRHANEVYLATHQFHYQAN